MNSFNDEVCLVVAVVSHFGGEAELTGPLLPLVVQGFSDGGPGAPRSE